MSKHYQDYFWKNGSPYGISSFKPGESEIVGATYKIVSDPYHKRISIEKYHNGEFTQVVYDSALFDFRHLQPVHQATWQKTAVSESEQLSICHIRNQDDRLILIEEYRFDNGLCRECRASSPQGILLSVQKIYYESLNDPFNGVILFDSNDHQVLKKRYQFDTETQQFTDLLEEQWDIQRQKAKGAAL